MVMLGDLLAFGRKGNRIQTGEIVDGQLVDLAGEIFSTG